MTPLAFRCFSAVLLLAASAAGQTEEATSDAESLAVRVVSLERLSPRQAQHLFYKAVEMQASDELGVVSLRGTPEQVEKVADLIAELDADQGRGTADTNVNLTVHLILAQASEQSEPPAEIVSLLRETLPYDDYALAETFVIRASAPKSEHSRSDMRISGLFANQSDAAKPPTTYSFWAQPQLVATEDGQTAIAFGDSRAQFRIPSPSPNNPTQFNYHDVNLQTSVAIPIGEPVLIGKVGVASEEGGIIVVAEANLAQN